MSKDFLIGGTAAIVSRTMTAPIELLRLQIQNNYLKHNSLSQIVEKEGMKNFKRNLNHSSTMIIMYIY